MSRHKREWPEVLRCHVTIGKSLFTKVRDVYEEIVYTIGAFINLLSWRDSASSHHDVARWLCRATQGQPRCATPFELNFWLQKQSSERSARPVNIALPPPQFCIYSDLRVVLNSFASLSRISLHSISDSYGRRVRPRHAFTWELRAYLKRRNGRR